MSLRYFQLISFLNNLWVQNYVLNNTKMLFAFSTTYILTHGAKPIMKALSWSWILTEPVTAKHFQKKFFNVIFGKALKID